MTDTTKPTTPSLPSATEMHQLTAAATRDALTAGRPTNVGYPPGHLTPGKAWGLRRLADDGGRFKMVAADQRPPIKDLAKQARGTATADEGDVADIKRLLIETLGSHATAVLLDPHYAYPRAIDAVSPRQGLLLTLEDSIFDETPKGRRSNAIDHWGVDKIRMIGGDAVKLLAWYRPDADPAVNEHQKAFVAWVGEECRRHDIPFLFELLVYSFPGEEQHTTDYVEQAAKRADQVIESVETFADPIYGVDVFKLESPIPANEVPDPFGDDTEAIERTRSLFAQLDTASSVPWVMLSAGAGKDAFRRVLHYAYEAGASGFLAGRAIWWDEVQAFPDLDATRAALSARSVPYLLDLNRITTEVALPYPQHRSIVEPTLPVGSAFRTDYGSLR